MALPGVGQIGGELVGNKVEDLTGSKFMGDVAGFAASAYLSGGTSVASDAMQEFGPEIAGSLDLDPKIASAAFGALSGDPEKAMGLLGEAGLSPELSQSLLEAVKSGDTEALMKLAEENPEKIKEALGKLGGGGSEGGIDIASMAGGVFG